MIYEKFKSMTIAEMANWIDKNGQFDGSPWLKWFDQEYCQKCEPVECTYSEAKEKLGITPFYDDTVECSYCEVYGKCRYFEDHKEVPDNKEIIKMWLMKLDKEVEEAG